MLFIYERDIVYIMHICYKYILQTICRLALNLLPYMKVRSVLTQWLKLCWKRKIIRFSNNIYLPWWCKFTTVLELKEIPIQECFTSNLEPLIQKSIIYQIQRKTLSDSVQSTTIHYISKGYWSIDSTMLFCSIGSSLTDFHGFLNAFMTNKAWST